MKPAFLTRERFKPEGLWNLGGAMVRITETVYHRHSKLPYWELGVRIVKGTPEIVLDKSRVVMTAVMPRRNDMAFIGVVSYLFKPGVRLKGQFFKGENTLGEFEVEG